MSAIKRQRRPPVRGIADVDRRCPISDNLHNETPISFNVA